MHVRWWVELSFFPLNGREASSGVFWGVCELSMTLGSLSADGWDCVPLFLVVCREVSSTGACRQLWGQALVLICYAYLHEHTHQLIFPGTGKSLEVQHHGLGAPTPEALARPLAMEPWAHKPHSVARERRKKRKKKKRKKKKENKQNPRQIAKTTTNRSNNNTYTEKRREEKKQENKEFKNENSQ